MPEEPKSNWKGENLDCTKQSKKQKTLQKKHRSWEIAEDGEEEQPTATTAIEEQKNREEPKPVINIVYPKKKETLE